MRNSEKDFDTMLNEYLDSEVENYKRTKNALLSNVTSLSDISTCNLRQEWNRCQGGRVSVLW